ncbi:DNA polymerase IV [soil metagenome]
MPLRYAFIDMNSYFASVEQQTTPSLRGRPIAIVPMADVNTTCCIAASKEAKKLGIKTGTPVWQARVLCPDIVLVPAKHEKYIAAHEAIVKAVNTCLPVAQVKSIDEMVCKLIGDERKPENAIALAHKIKRAIRERAGECLTSSIGIGPNSLLAKLGTDLQKPDGLTVIREEDLPHRLYGISLTDFCGIGKQMEKRFHRLGVTTVEQMLRLTPAHLSQVWGSKVHGWRWWYLLRGHDVPDKETTRRTVGHSHILPPEKRNEVQARGVLMRLVHKAAARMRKIEYCAGAVVVHVSYLGEEHTGWGGGGWAESVGLPHCQDTPALLEAAALLWSRKPAGKILKIGVTFMDLVPAKGVTPSLFDMDHKAQKLSEAMDQANRTFGPNAVYFGSIVGNTKGAPMRISFTHIPDEETESAESLRQYGW